MFDKFGEMESAEQINELASNLLKEGDTESIKALAKENGIDEELAEIFISGDIPALCDDLTAAVGKLDIEAADLKPAEIMLDWIEYVKTRCAEDENTAKRVRNKEKTLKGMVAEILKWSFAHQYTIDKEIMKAAGVNASKCTLGIPGMGTVKELITKYYTGGQE